MKCKRRIWWMMAWWILLSIIVFFVPSLAAKQEGCRYSVNGIVQNANTLEKALIMCAKNGGGTVWVYADTKVGYEGEEVLKITENTELILCQGACMEIGDAGLKVDGTIIIQDGKLDVSKSEGKLFGSGSVISETEGTFVRKPYVIENTGKLCFVAEDLIHGQKLSEAEVLYKNIEWKCEISGEWRFVDQEICPEVGEHLFDIEFVPSNGLTYETATFKEAGKITVKEIMEEKQQENSAVSLKPDAVEEERDPIIITRMVSKTSTIVSHLKVKAPKIKKIKRKNRKITIVCGSRKNCRYEIRYSSNKKLKMAKKRRFKKSTFTIKNLKKKKVYYFKIRTYSQKTKQYSKWSALRCA